VEAKTAVCPVLGNQGATEAGNQPFEQPGVLLLLSDEQCQRIDVVRVVGIAALRLGEEEGPLAALSELEMRERPGQLGRRGGVLGTWLVPVWLGPVEPAAFEMPKPEGEVHAFMRAGDRCERPGGDRISAEPLDSSAISSRSRHVDVSQRSNALGRLHAPRIRDQFRELVAADDGRPDGCSRRPGAAVWRRT
jgi:hypothetical protein